MKSVYLRIPCPSHAQCTQDVEDPVKRAEEVMWVKFVDNRDDPVDVVEEVVVQVIEGTEDKEDKEVFNDVKNMFFSLPFSLDLIVA